MTTTQLQNAMLAQLLSDLDAIDAEARTMQNTLTDEELRRPAPGGGWTVGQVFEHLIVANSLYYEQMEKALATGKPAGSSKWRPTLFGRMLVKSLSPQSTRKLPTPRIFKPDPAPRAGVVRAFLESQERFRALARQADGLDLKRTRMTSPVNSLIRINFGDAFRVIVVHEQRHFQQIRRILGR